MGKNVRAIAIVLGQHKLGQVNFYSIFLSLALCTSYELPVLKGFLTICLVVDVIW